MHAEFVDELLDRERSEAMRAHADDCPACSLLNIRVRRSLLALQALLAIEPSANFRERLRERLARRTAVKQTRVRGVHWGVAVTRTQAGTLAGGPLNAASFSAPPTVRLQLAN